MKTILGILLALTSSFAFAESQTQQHDATNLKTLVVSNSAGDIKILANSSDKATVVFHEKNESNSCKVTQTLVGEKLIVKATGKKTGWFNFSSCRVDFEITVPKKTALILKGGASDLEISGITAPIEFRVGSGDIRLNVESEKLVGKTGSGNIEAQGKLANAQLKSGSGNVVLTGVTGDAEVKSGSGNILVTYSEAVTKGDLQVRTGSGNASLYVPTGMKVFTKLKSGSGKITNQLGNFSDSDFKVSMKSGSGNISLSTVK